MIYFLSDAHLGSRAITNAPEHIQKNVSLLQQMEKDATAVYLLGDIFDFWYEYIWEQYQVKDGQKNGKLKYVLQNIYLILRKSFRIVYHYTSFFMDL